tara:strand:+ start:439 stop:573 length:135 start_codon:yes stop_codon:yes gene_type:complete
MSKVNNIQIDREKYFDDLVIIGIKVIHFTSTLKKEQRELNWFYY